MPMSLWGLKFPEIAAAETRSITIPDGYRVPAGSYGLMEFFCDEVDCDCRRVIISVVCQSTGQKVWATISYGWEPQEFYGEWMRDPDMIEQINGAFLDPLGPQSEYAYDFLDYFLYMLDNDQAYAERIQRHYRMFKATLTGRSKQRTSGPGSYRPKATSKAKRRKR